MKSITYRLIFYLLLSTLPLMLASCNSTNNSKPNFSKSNQEKSTKKTENKLLPSSEIDVNKLKKEAAYMIAFDIGWGFTCEAGLNLVAGACFIIDTVGDIAIIAYQNLSPPKTKKENSAEIAAADKNSLAKKEKKESEKSGFHPIELGLSIALMAITLILI